MKFRHAAVLVLVGWYLIAPGNKFVPDSAGDAGMATEWFQLGSFAALIVWAAGSWESEGGARRAGQPEIRPVT